MSTCRSCGAPIVWCVSASTGKRMPVDAIPDPNGNIVLDRAGAEPVVTVRPEAGLQLLDPPDLELHLSHFVTCPDSKDWRR